MSEVDVIIVGAGLSGLSAARALSQRGLSLAVLEASDRVGGRTYTVYPSHGDPPFGWADLGASYVGPTQYHLLRLSRELGVASFLCSDDLESVQFRKGKRYIYDGVLPNMWWRNPLVAWDQFVMLRRLEKMVWEIPTDKPWEAPHAHEWDQMTVKEFYDKHCWTKQCSEYLAKTSNMDICSDERDMSILFYLWYMRQASGPRRLWGVTGGAEEGKFVGGSQQLAEKMAEQLESPVLLNEPVVMIKHDASSVTVRTLNGTEFKSKYLILATPPITQMKIHFDPPLSAMRSCLIQHSPMGLVMKCVVFYNKPFWEEKGFNGYVTCSDGVEVAALVTEDHKPGVKLCGLICFILLEKMLEMLEMSDEEKQQALCTTLARFFDSEEAHRPVKFMYKVWSKEQYIGGGYTAHYPPGALTMFGRAIRAPLGLRVFLAGTETATHWTGYMSGAIDAGQRAAREVLHASGLIKEHEIWVQEPTFRYQPSWVEKMVPSIDAVVYVGMLVPLIGSTFVVYKCFSNANLILCASKSYASQDYALLSVAYALMAIPFKVLSKVYSFMG